MRLTPATHLGPYEIIALLGAGGMGEVYRARDLRLGREVAIKVLPPSFSQDADRLRRFEQEARTTSGLNHPNIVAIYDVGTYENSPYIVSELLDGETLRERMGGAALPPRKATDYAVQIARGLAAAHQQGIVHRDLKPENVFVTRDGRVKILDFGLAKLTARAVPEEAATVSMDAPKTEGGVAMGTVGYMAPEQVRGQPTDTRADIFAFGAILYEMLAGRRAFLGTSSSDTLSAILRDEPPALDDPAFERVVRRCLEKSPEERFQSALDLAFDLQALASGSRPHAAQAPRRRSWAMVSAAVLGIAACASAFFAGRTTGKPGAAAPATFKQLTFRRGFIQAARFAPDGRIIYSASWDGRPMEIFEARPGSPESKPLGFTSAGILAISSLGEMAISTECAELNWALCTGTMATVPLAGGAPRPVKEHVIAADWAPDGKRMAVVFTDEAAYKLEFDGKVLYESKGWMDSVAVSPSGDWIAFQEYPALGDRIGSLAVLDLSGKKRTLVSGWDLEGGFAWSPTGQEIWLCGAKEGRNTNFYAVSLFGAVRPIYRSPGGVGLFDVSRDGRILLTHGAPRSGIVGLSPGETRERQLSWFDWSTVADLSADGKTLLFYEWGEGVGAVRQVYMRKTDGSDAVKLGEGKALALSPDGRWALALRQTSPPQLVLLPTGAGQQKTLAQSGVLEYSFAFWYPDGQRIGFVAAEPGHEPRSYVQDVDGGKARPVTEEGTYGFLVSPDGKRMIINSGGVLFIVPEEGERVPVKGLDLGDVPVQWSADGRSLYVRGRGAFTAPVFRLDLSSGQRKPWKVFAPPDPAGVFDIAIDSGFRLTPDGRGYAYTYWSWFNELYLAEGLK